MKSNNSISFNIKVNKSDMAKLRIKSKLAFLLLRFAVHISKTKLRYDIEQS